jgi:hypothetical protein
MKLTRRHPAWPARALSAVLLACILPLSSGAFAQQQQPTPEPTPQPAPTAAPTATPTPTPTPTEPAPSATVETKVKAAPPKVAIPRRITTPVVVAGIISGVAFVTGTVFAVSAASQSSKYDEQPDHQVALDGESAMFIADVSFGLGALFGLSALALYFLPDEPTPSATTATKPPARSSWLSSALKGQVRF